jgi:hypothetical protein
MTAVLSIMPKQERSAYEKQLERIYADRSTQYRKLATAEPESPQWYFEQFLKSLESKYQLPMAKYFPEHKGKPHSIAEIFYMAAFLCYRFPYSL